jgi:FkbM family methyltransferase
MRAFALQLYSFAIRLVRGAVPWRVINGHLVSLEPKSRLYFRLLGRTEYELLEWIPARALVQRGDVVIDVGANIGILSVLMARLAGGNGRVIAIEPQPAIYTLLRGNLQRNRCDSAQVVWGAAGAAEGEVNFFVSHATDLGVSSSLALSASQRSVVAVPLLTLDSCAAGARVAYVKIDVEGAEVGVIHGATAILAAQRPFVQIEVHGQYLADFGDSVDAVFLAMRTHDYVPINLATWELTSPEEFSTDTGYRVNDESGADLGRCGYGHLLFVPAERLDATLERLRREIQRPIAGVLTR